MNQTPAEGNRTVVMVMLSTGTNITVGDPAPDFWDKLTTATEEREVLAWDYSDGRTMMISGAHVVGAQRTHAASATSVNSPEFLPASDVTGNAETS